MGRAVIPILPVSQWAGRAAANAEAHGAAPADAEGRSAAPILVGPAELLEKVLGGLRSVVDPVSGGNLVEGRWIRSLQLRGDEADLTLACNPRTPRGALLADASFCALRRLLPDTDVYVRAA